MCRAKYLFALAVCVIALLMKGHSYRKCTRSEVPQGKLSLFLETKLADLGTADPPYTVFNFATEAANTTDVLEDELRRKENKAMRRFRHDLVGKEKFSERVLSCIGGVHVFREKKERTANFLASLLKDSLQFFDPKA
ncbi:hypothetical protein C922_01206 [Plasmodium inui San Antonio 1]|uniref:Plasmodium RESA N-terminal domain-containing protein n=1 Tax=Plasmodium inui San Antonio 1 TaxID=1237626 RepID=W7AA79_9APIC|nr:hypothetical protein C922_01206 [Plasmodium inui San Antonio 1]EUD68188.1 hypothetical protein C922_01206 [Plasmodium inui San Antonio 1]